MQTFLLSTIIEIQKINKHIENSENQKKIGNFFVFFIRDYYLSNSQLYKHTKNIVLYYEG